MGDACRALDTPVTGGNVSFYNENPGGAVFPTPTIGMLGLVEDLEHHGTPAAFQHTGDIVYLLTPDAWIHRTAADDLGGSEYLSGIHRMTAGRAPHLSLDEEKAVQQALLTLIRAQRVSSAHDVSDGGLAVCLAEAACFSGTLGATIDLTVRAPYRVDSLLFSEAQSRIVFTAPPAHKDAIRQLLDGSGAQAHPIGEVIADRLCLRVNGGVVTDEAVAVLHRIHDQAIEQQLHPEST